MSCNCRRVAKFEKVSFDEFKKAVNNLGYPFSDSEIEEYYNNIQLPKRSTKDSAGYDFKAPFNFRIGEKESLIIPTGLCCKIKSDWYLAAFPRSGQGFKFGVRLANTTGIIDSDYYNADNEGHIMIKLVHDGVVSSKDLVVETGNGFAQGIFSPYGITEDDDADGDRTGGFGSTDNK